MGFHASSTRSEGGRVTGSCDWDSSRFPSSRRSLPKPFVPHPDLCHVVGSVHRVRGHLNKEVSLFMLTAPRQPRDSFLAVSQTLPLSIYLTVTSWKRLNLTLQGTQSSQTLPLQCLLTSCPLSCHRFSLFCMPALC